MKRHGLKWTEEEEETLRDLAGVSSLDYISGRLGRSKEAIYSKIVRLGIINLKEEGGWISANELSGALGISFRKLMRLHENHGLPLLTQPITKRNKEAYVYKVYRASADSFWKWAKDHKDKLDFTKIDPDMLIPIPSWFQEELKKDMNEIPSFTKVPWTPGEDVSAWDYFYGKGLTQKEIAQKLGRTERAVQRRLTRIRKIKFAKE